MSEVRDEPPGGLRVFWVDRFVESCPIGHGRNATVFRAWDTHLERVVAFKTPADDRLAPELMDTETLAKLGVAEGVVHGIELIRAEAELRQRYSMLREAQLLAQVDHPNVLAVLDIGILEDDTVAVVLPYLDGGTLEEQEFPGPWQDVLDVTLQIGRGLAAIHEAGLLHRDFKPNNILFGSDGRPRIADLGLACRLDDAEAMADWVGTPGYMAPEVSEQILRDVRDDLYAFCVVAF